MAKTHIQFTLNGAEVETLVEPRELLIHVIREQLGQTGSHIGCETSHCGACTVDLNGQSLKSCTILAVQANGGDVITVEGLAASGELHAVQEAFMQEHGLQCGFCTPGMLMRSYRFLQENPDPTEEEKKTRALFKVRVTMLMTLSYRVCCRVKLYVAPLHMQK